MPAFLQNVLMLALCWIAATGAGVYLTFFQQPEELERLQKLEKVERLKEAEVATLLAEEAASERLAEEVLTRWRARYKFIPDSLTSAHVVGFMNDLTSRGFENFDLDYDGISHTQDYSTHTFRISGKGYFTSLYRFIWEVENHRDFYRISDLELSHIDLVSTDRDTGRERMRIMVAFDFAMEAFYAGAAGLSAPEPSLFASEEDGVWATTGELPPVPRDVLPKERPNINPFFPLIMQDLPPNTRELVNVEAVELVSIVGEQAIFKEGDRYRTVSKGGEVYLGILDVVDPSEGRVVARLNKGGIVDEVEMVLQSGERFRQALGSVRLAPALDGDGNP